VGRLLAALRGPAVSSLTTEKLARELVGRYRRLAGPERVQLLLHLATTHCVDAARAREAAGRLAAAPAGAPQARQEEEMRARLVPPHNLVYSRLGQLEGGVKFLVDLRADLLAAARAETAEVERAALALMNTSLQVAFAPEGHNNT
jgi:malonyl-CoA decarboxylase